MRAGALGLALVLLLGGCGYTVHGTLPADIRTVAVPIFRNRTRQPAVESLVTRAVVEAFSTNGRLRVVNTAEADAILDGEVTNYGVTSIAFDKDANVSLYRVFVTVNLVLRDVKRKTILFKQAEVREQADFRVQAAVSQTISLEDTSLRTAATDIGRAIVALTVTRF